MTTTPTTQQEEPVELTKSLREAMNHNELENVFEAAGATKITGKATEVLGETTAAHVAPRLASGQFKVRTNQSQPDSKLVKAAEGAFDTKKLQAALGNEDIDPEKGRKSLAREMARIATNANQFAQAEQRPVCHNCSAVGAARAAAQLEPQS